MGYALGCVSAADWVQEMVLGAGYERDSSSSDYPTICSEKLIMASVTTCGYGRGLSLKLNRLV